MPLLLRCRMAINAIVPDEFPWLDTSRYSFSPAVEAAGTTWAAGQTAGVFDEASGRIVVAGDAGEQASLCWDKVTAVLAAAGRTPADCSELVEYVTPAGLADRAGIESARPAALSNSALDAGTVAGSTVVVDSLVRPEAMIEIEVVAGQPAGVVRIPQVLPIDDDGAVVAPGDFVAQCEWVLEEAGRRLATHGLGLGDVVKVVQQTTPATRRQYADTAEARRRLLGPSFPSSTGVLVSQLPHPEALVALDVWASSGAKGLVPYAEEAYASLTFSPAVVAGGLVFISGTTAWDPSTGDTVAPGDIAAQADYIYDQIALVCEAAGTSVDQLVKTVEYVAPDGLDRYREVGEIRQRVLGRPFPASTGVVVAGLLSRKWMIEVEAVAVVPDPAP